MTTKGLWPKGGDSAPRRNEVPRHGGPAISWTCPCSPRVTALPAVPMLQPFLQSLCYSPSCSLRVTALPAATPSQLALLQPYLQSPCYSPSCSHAYTAGPATALPAVPVLQPFLQPQRYSSRCSPCVAALPAARPRQPVQIFILRYSV